MERFKRFSLVAPSLMLVLALVTVLGSKPVHALVASMVVVVNNASNPVPTVRVDNPARQAVVLRVQFGIPEGWGDNTAHLQDAGGDYRVPIGKRLVIEALSGEIRVPPGQKAQLDFFTTANSVSGHITPVPVFVITDGFPHDVYSFATQFTSYTDEGTRVQVNCHRLPFNIGKADCDATVSGHLENIP